MRSSRRCSSPERPTGNLLPLEISDGTFVIPNEWEKEVSTALIVLAEPDLVVARKQRKVDQGGLDGDLKETRNHQNPLSLGPGPNHHRKPLKTIPLLVSEAATCRDLHDADDALNADSIASDLVVPRLVGHNVTRYEGNGWCA